MAGIVTTLITHDIFNSIGKQINDFAFTLITPLGAEYRNTFSHNFCL